MKKLLLIGPFSQLLPMTGIPLKGAVSDVQMRVLPDAGILVENGRVSATGRFSELRGSTSSAEVTVIPLHGTCIGLPGFIDPHTHICFAGSRARDYALRNSGKSYLEISRAGGGIWDTVLQTRKAGMDDLVSGIATRAGYHLRNGVTTIEVKSGYGLSVAEELKILKAIRKANSQLAVDLIPTCLAAHMVPRDFSGDAADYLLEISSMLFPLLRSDNLSNRIDAFVETGAFTTEDIKPYFEKARSMGFDLTVHADQFTTGGSALAVSLEATSADHLEASTDKEIQLLAESNVIATALPGASMGLGCKFTPVRKILDAGGSVAIASDHNPGSAPMGDLLTQAAVLGAFEKLSCAEVFSGLTFRAAAALGLSDRGSLAKNCLADFSVFQASDYNEILYHQGTLKPIQVFKEGNLVYESHENRHDRI